MSGIKAGEIDIVDSAVDSEYKIRFLIKLVNLINSKLPTNSRITQGEFDALLEQAQKEVISKYPNSGIHRKK